MKIISWNVNGIRACLKKNFINFVLKEKPDILCLQEVKAHFESVENAFAELKDYKIVWNSAKKNGYSGTAVFTKIEPKKIDKGFGIEKFDTEGRVISLEFENFILFNVYFPNGQKDDQRLKYKLDFYKEFFDLCNKLKNKGKNILICGDYNTAHKEIDLANPKQNSDYSGFLPIERKWLDKIESYGFVDTFREFDKSPKKYTWWSYKFNARERNIGWRIDYFFVSKKFMKNIKDSYIMAEVFGSDHCPVGIIIN